MSYNANILKTSIKNGSSSKRPRKVIIKGPSNSYYSFSTLNVSNYRSRYSRMKEQNLDLARGMALLKQKIRDLEFQLAQHSKYSLGFLQIKEKLRNVFPVLQDINLIINPPGESLDPRVRKNGPGPRMVRDNPVMKLMAVVEESEPLNEDVNAAGIVSLNDVTDMELTVPIPTTSIEIFNSPGNQSQSSATNNKTSAENSFLYNNVALPSISVIQNRQDVSTSKLPIPKNSEDRDQRLGTATIKSTLIENLSIDDRTQPSITEPIVSKQTVEIRLEKMLTENDQTSHSNQLSTTKLTSLKKIVNREERILGIGSEKVLSMMQPEIYKNKFQKPKNTVKGSNQACNPKQEVPKIGSEVSKVKKITNESKKSSQVLSKQVVTHKNRTSIPSEVLNDKNTSEEQKITNDAAMILETAAKVGNPLDGKSETRNKKKTSEPPKNTNDVAPILDATAKTMNSSEGKPEHRTKKTSEEQNDAAPVATAKATNSLERKPETRKKKNTSEEQNTANDAAPSSKVTVKTPHPQEQTSETIPTLQEVEKSDAESTRMSSKHLDAGVKAVHSERQSAVDVPASSPEHDFKKTSSVGSARRKTFSGPKEMRYSIEEYQNFLLNEPNLAESETPAFQNNDDENLPRTLEPEEIAQKITPLAISKSNEQENPISVDKLRKADDEKYQDATTENIPSTETSSKLLKNKKPPKESLEPRRSSRPQRNQHRPNYNFDLPEHWIPVRIKAERISGEFDNTIEVSDPNLSEYIPEVPKKKKKSPRTKKSTKKTKPVKTEMVSNDGSENEKEIAGSKADDPVNSDDLSNKSKMNIPQVAHKFFVHTKPNSKKNIPSKTAKKVSKKKATIPKVPKSKASSEHDELNRSTTVFNISQDLSQSISGYVSVKKNKDEINKKDGKENTPARAENDEEFCKNVQPTVKVPVNNGEEPERKSGRRKAPANYAEPHLNKKMRRE